MAWTTVRTLVAVAAEGRAAAPLAGAFVPIVGIDPFTGQGEPLPYCEVGFDSLSVAGAPTDVTFGIWRMADGKADRVGYLTIPASEVASPTPRILDFHGDTIAVTAESFTGGAGPTVSAVVRVRGCKP